MLYNSLGSPTPARTLSSVLGCLDNIHQKTAARGRSAFTPYHETLQNAYQRARFVSLLRCNPPCVEWGGCIGKSRGGPVFKCPASPSWGLSARTLLWLFLYDTVPEGTRLYCLNANPRSMDVGDLFIAPLFISPKSVGLWRRLDRLPLMVQGNRLIQCFNSSGSQTLLATPRPEKKHDYTGRVNFLLSSLAGSSSPVDKEIVDDENVFEEAEG